MIVAMGSVLVEIEPTIEGSMNFSGKIAKTQHPNVMIFTNTMFPILAGIRRKRALLFLPFRHKKKEEANINMPKHNRMGSMCATISPVRT